LASAVHGRLERIGSSALVKPVLSDAIDGQIHQIAERTDDVA
jgi:hypothetical protein